MNKIFTIILLCILSLPVCVLADDNVLNGIEQAPVVNTLDEDLDMAVEKEANELYKQPISKRKIAKKFLIAMGAVAVSSISLFFILSLYNKIRENYFYQTQILDDEKSLEIPEDLNGAIKAFLDKTDWTL
ncbi:hypothetical protein J6R97_03320 [bacterium]|nr:hypothetical protein [bacterium]